MTSVRKRKMARSSIRKNTRRVKDKKKDVNIHSNPIIAANWDKSLTLQQNYKRLGLASKLSHIAGGQEQKVETLTQIRERKAKEDEFSIKPADIENIDDPNSIPEGEARLVRDPETNEITKILYGAMKVPARNKSDEIEKPEVIKQLEEYGEKYSKIKHDRVQSEREQDWIKALYEKHGDDYEKMKWDKKLNINQQSAGDLKRRIQKWKKLKIL